MGAEQSDANGNNQLNPFCCNSNLCNNDNNIENKNNDLGGANYRKNNYRKSNHASNQSQ